MFENYGIEEDKEGEDLVEDIVKNFDENFGIVEISIKNFFFKLLWFKVEEEGGENVDEYNNNEMKVVEDKMELEV